MRVLVCGDRDWTNKEFLFSTLDQRHQREPISTVIEGDCRGADRMAGEWAESRNIPLEKYPAQWNRYGLGAGPIRNKQMLDEGKPDWVFAFHNNIDASKGTKNMCNQAKSRNIPSAIFMEP